MIVLDVVALWNGLHLIGISSWNGFNYWSILCTLNIPPKSCSSRKHKLYRMVSLVVINSKWFEHGDHAADWIEPLGMIHRSGVHLFVCHTRNTPPTVDVNSRWLFGDHFANAHGIPIRFNAIFRFESTSHKIAFESLKLTLTNNEPFRFHSNELIGWWCVLNSKWNSFDLQMQFVSKSSRMASVRLSHLVKCRNWDECRPSVSNRHMMMPLFDPTANSLAHSGRQANDVTHFW